MGTKSRRPFSHSDFRRYRRAAPRLRAIVDGKKKVRADFNAFGRALRDFDFDSAANEVDRTNCQ